MNKLQIMLRLANAYHTLPAEDDNINYSAKQFIDDRFNYFRRSLRIEDLKPQPKHTEGLNPNGPRYL
jgi:hypothetical protein